MNKTFILALITLSLVFAAQKYTYAGCEENNSCYCHPSCICDAGQTICKQCRLSSLGAVMDDFKKSCPCPPGYYTSSLSPFTCTPLIVPTQQGNDCDEACKKEIGLKMSNISLNTNCYFCNIDGKSFVISEVSLNYNSVSLSADCKKLLKHKIQFLHPQYQTYTDLKSQYFTLGENGSLTIKIPLIDVYNLSLTNTVGQSQISQQINLLSWIGTSDKFLKQIRWAICIYTNRDAVQVFQLDIDIQQTQQDCEDCIVIADLETVGTIYTDSTFLAAKSSPYQYFVGDYFYAKITFKDASYTKFLKFVSLYYKNDLGQIFDYSSITVHSWQGNGLTIALPLSEPSHPAVIQVLMKIDAVSGGRFLEEGSQQQQKSNFSFEVASDKQGNNNTNNEASNSASVIIFGLLNLFAVLFLL